MKEIRNASAPEGSSTIKKTNPVGIKGYLLGLFLTSILYTATAKHELLECDPIPDQVQVKLQNSTDNTVINNPSPSELKNLVIDKAKFLSAHFNMPSIYIGADTSFSEWIRTLIRNPRSFNQDEFVHTNISITHAFSSPATMTEDAIYSQVPPFKILGSLENPKFRIEGFTDHKTEHAVTHTPWWLEKSENHPGYWIFKGDVKVSKSELAGYIARKLSVDEYYYKCKLSEVNSGYTDFINLRYDRMNNNIPYLRTDYNLEAAPLAIELVKLQQSN